MATSRLEVDLSAVSRNVGIIREALEAGRAASSAALDPAPQGGPARIPVRAAVCAVVKQDAYGLGAPRVGKALAALGAEMLAVYSLDESRAFVDAPIQTPILVLAPVRHIDRADTIYRLAVRGRLHLTVHDADQAQELAATAARLGCRIPVHVALDTGMSRGGSLEPQATRTVELVLTSSRLTLAGVMTHFSSPACDDAFTREQAKAFRAWIESIRPSLPAVTGGAGLLIHAANTAATLRSRSLHANMVRIGQGLYGYGGEGFADPLAVEFASFGKKLQPAVRWTSSITHVHEVPKGWPVGYGRTFRAPRPTKVALVPVGYAEGYPIALSNAASVAVMPHDFDRPRTGVAPNASPTPGPAAERPAFAPVIGRVSMDQLTIDVTGLPERFAHPGAEVELIGTDPQAPHHLPTLAKAAATITHELLCRISPKVERVYVFSGARTPGASDDHLQTSPAARSATSPAARLGLSSIASAPLSAPLAG